MSTDRSDYKLIRLQRKHVGLHRVDACRKVCGESGRSLLPIQKSPHNADTAALSKATGYDQSLLIITDGVEIYENKVSTVYSFPFSGQKLAMRVGIDFFKSNFRAANKPGTYCMNLYYGSYVSRDCVVAQRDLCACKKGRSLVLFGKVN